MPGTSPDPAPPPAARSRLRALGLNLLLLAGSLAAALLLLEAVLRLAGGRESPTAQLSAVHAYDSLLGWRTRPGAVDSIRTAEYALVERFNSRGARGPERAIPKPRGVRRILFLGDSFLEGYTVDEAHLVTTLVEQALSAPGRTVETVNLGTAGYGTDQEVLQYEREGRSYEPDVTVVMFYLNDVWYNTAASYWRGGKPLFVAGDSGLRLTNVPVPPPDTTAFRFRVEGGSGLTRLVRGADAWFGRHSALYQRLRGVMRTSPAISGLLIRLGFATVPGEFEAWRATPTPRLVQAWRVTELLLARLQADVARDGGRLVVFHVPTKAAVRPQVWHATRRRYAMREEEWNARQDEIVLRGICERRDLDCVFPTPEFLAGAADHRFYFDADPHWTADGHALAARVLADHIRGMLPGPTR